MMNAKILRPLKGARKAKYGFAGPSIALHNIKEVAHLIDYLEQNWQNKYVAQMSGAMSTNDFRIYTDEPDVAADLSNNFCYT